MSVDIYGEKGAFNMVKLHLGCGTRYLDGYVNIDYPPAQQLTENQVKADIYTDLLGLNYSPASVIEVRNHHVFEHFSRPVALALLFRWTDWLAEDGVLRIETPDMFTSAQLLTAENTSSGQRYQIMRHIFGSHEAPWAIHYDGWYADKFRDVLTVLSYKEIVIKEFKWESLCNIEVIAKSSGKRHTFIEYKEIAEQILSKSLISHRPFGGLMSDKISLSEIQMLQIWMADWQKAYEKS